jgi:hypothetical protein
VWGEQAVVANSLPGLTKQEFDDALLGLWADSIDDTMDPERAATACVIIAMQYANQLDFSVQEKLAEVVGLMK